MRSFTFDRATRGRRVERDAATRVRFRVEPLEPRLLLSGDPLDLLKDSIEPQLAPEPVVAIDETVSAPSPSIDWGSAISAPEDKGDNVLAVITAPPATSEPTAPVVAGPVVTTEAQSSMATSSSTTVAADAGQEFVASVDPVASQISSDHDARGPPASADENAGLGSAEAPLLSPEPAVRALSDGDLLPAVVIAQSGLDLPGLRLVSGDVSALAGQVVYLDFDGEAGVTYRGPVRVEHIAVPPFRAPGDLAGEEAAVIGAALTRLNEDFADLAVTFTASPPDAKTEY